VQEILVMPGQVTLVQAAVQAAYYQEQVLL
jgi:hypothetical protein